MTYGVTNPEWRDTVPAADLAHWETVWAREEETARRAEAEGVTYEDIPWHKARGRRDLIGKRAVRAYWIGGGDTPWGHQHAHMYASAFKVVTGIDSDWITYDDGTSESLISYDTICVREPAA
jgi:hypothetical protein